MNEHAFPQTFQEDYNGNVVQASHPGMTLRDYFAAHAPIPDRHMALEDHCAYRYRYADAMLKARQA